MFLILFLLMSKKKFNKLVLNMDCFLVLLKLNGQLLENQTWLPKIIIKQKYRYLNLNVIWHNQRVIFILKTTGLKIVSIQEKSIFTTGCFKYTFLVKTTPINLYFVIPLEAPKNRFVWFLSLCSFNQICSTWRKYFCIQWLRICSIWCKRTCCRTGYFLATWIIFLKCIIWLYG